MTALANRTVRAQLEEPQDAVLVVRARLQRASEQLDRPIRVTAQRRDLRLEAEGPRLVGITRRRFSGDPFLT